VSEVGKIREFLGLGPSKSQRIDLLEHRLRVEADLLDQMAFRCPNVFRDVTTAYDGCIHYRPGVHKLELQQVMRAQARNRAQFESECG